MLLSSGGDEAIPLLKITIIMILNRRSTHFYCSEEVLQNQSDAAEDASNYLSRLPRDKMSEFNSDFVFWWR